MKDSRKALGHKGETLAVLYLEGKGYEIIERNFRCRRGEIDIIAQKENELIFIEVRSRSTNNYGSAIESINYRKQQRIRTLALIYMQRKQRQEVNCSFDVITFQFTGAGENPVIHHYPRAF